jgi:sodium transport system ATP-binding protein
MIHAEALTKVFAASGGRSIEAVRDATFSVEPGEIFGLLGPNGAGKTTLLRMLGTIIQPTSGWCSIAGMRTSDAPEKVRKQIGFLSGNTKLYGRLTSKEILRYFGRLYGMSQADIQRRSAELAELLNMGEFFERRCDTLSTGQLQRVSIARVILHNPQVLILDEPTLGLDIMTSRAILDFILDAKRQGRCIIFSTHYMTEAEMLCDRLGLMHAGSIMSLGTLEELYRQTECANLQDAFLAFARQSEQKSA